ncbi:hypothetical protein B0T21DRAFT_445114 [Apiosordaria backusii]|uniref:Uncharacterized protein n=1 Tax=Apiosordaria backusii TaxID=314023 RepID=A0AA40B7S4_9PEZI|nr:hypothetical protein B0T21DRAFT_445114 [Apiosordaria backusii]
MKATLPLLVLAGSAFAVPVPEEQAAQQAQQAQAAQQMQQMQQLQAALEAQLLDGLPIIGPLLSGLLGGLTGGGGGGGLPILGPLLGGLPILGPLLSGLPLIGGLLGGGGGGAGNPLAGLPLVGGLLGGGGAGGLLGGLPLVGGLTGGLPIIGGGGAGLPLPLALPTGAALPSVQATPQGVDAGAAIQKRNTAYAQTMANYYALLSGQVNQEALAQMLTEAQAHLEKIKQTLAENADKTPEEKAEAVREPLQALDEDLKVGVSRLALPGVSGLNGLPLVGNLVPNVLGGGPGGPLGIVSGILKLVTDLLTSLLSSGPVGGGGIGGAIGGGGLLNEVVGGTGIGGTVGGLIFNSPLSGLLQSILGTVGSILPIGGPLTGGLIPF